MQRYAIVALLLCFSCLPGRAQPQPVYTYQQLSKTYYATQKDSLKKAWVCPDISTTKAVQKIYREIWDGRTEFLLSAIENQHYIYEPGLYNYLQGIIAGKILKTYSTNVDLTTQAVAVGRGFGASIREISYLKYGMQLKNIAKYGFCLFYGDGSKQDLLVFDAAGNLRRDKKITADVNSYYLFSSSPNFYLLTRRNGYQGEEGNSLLMYSITDSTTEYKYDLIDKHGDWLKALTFDNDPVTGKAFLAGCIINPDRTKSFTTARDYSNAPYVGLFTLNLGGDKKDIQANYSYWNDEHMPGINRDGLFSEKSFYVKYATAFKDYNGNTVFAGAALMEKRLLGAAKYRLADGVFLVQDPKGQLKLDNNIPCDETSYFGPASSVLELAL